jgi:hypothetical protein
MAYNVAIRTLAWISFWTLLLLAVTTDWSRTLSDWHNYQSKQTTFPVPHSDWG